MEIKEITIKVNGTKIYSHFGAIPSGDTDYKVYAIDDGGQKHIFTIKNVNYYSDAVMIVLDYFCGCCNLFTYEFKHRYTKHDLNDLAFHCYDNKGNRKGLVGTLNF